jgi:hypothetical protein
MKELGADTVINHHKKLSEEFEKFNLPGLYREFEWY